MHKVAGNEPAEFEFRNDGPVSLFAMIKADLEPFIKNNPGIVMKLAYEF
jgi:hypothetical protein